METLRGDGIVVRPFRPDDAPDVAAACADPLIQRFLTHLPSPYTLDDAQWWVGEGAPAAPLDPELEKQLGG